LAQRYISETPDLKAYTYRQKGVVQDHKDYSDKSHLYKSKYVDPKSKEMSDLLLGYNPSIVNKNNMIYQDDLSKSRIVYPDNYKIVTKTDKDL